MADVDDTNPAMLQLVQSSAPAVGDPDQALVNAAKGGDRAAFDALVIRHQQRVFAMCSRLLRNASDVDDAVQQTFLEAWRSLHRFEGKSRFTTWLTRVAINTTFSLRRRVRRWVLVGDLGGGERQAALAVIDGGVDPDGRGPLPADELLSRRRHSEGLREILATLSEKKRTVFVLMELEGLSSPECGEVLGIPEATVRTRLFYARQEVGEAMASHPAFTDVMDKVASVAERHLDRGRGGEASTQKVRSDAASVAGRHLDRGRGGEASTQKVGPRRSP